MFRISRYLTAALGTALCAAALAGCAGHQLPAIDPSGERIFSGASTTILSPLAECPLLHPSPRIAAPACPPVLPSVPVGPIITAPQPLAIAVQPIPQPAPVCNPPARVAAPVTAPPPCN